MNINSVNNSKYLSVKPAFTHKHEKSKYSCKEKAIIAGSTALGVGVSLALLAKSAKYSLNPKKMFNNIKKSYLAREDFLVKQVLAMGAGTCLGGLAGGYIVDKNPENRKAKQREAVMQIGNIAIPILTVGATDKMLKKASKPVKTAASLTSVLVGVYLANFLMNKLGNVIFHNKAERGIKATDFSAHLDDLVVSASYISKSDFVHYVSRVVPLALMVPGIEVGNKTAHHDCR